MGEELAGSALPLRLLHTPTNADSKSSYENKCSTTLEGDKIRRWKKNVVIFLSADRGFAQLRKNLAERGSDVIDILGLPPAKL